MIPAIRRCMLAVLLASALLPFALSANVASAHGHTTVGDYELVIGFHNEPAYQGQPNGLDLFVTNTKTSQPVSGLEDTLKAELIYGGSTREFTIRAQWGEEGAYTADVVPTKDGAYTWRIIGDIEGTPVDVSMTAGPDTFGEVNAMGALAFPAADPTAAELQQQINTARTIGIAGAVLGVLGIVVGAAALLSRRSAGAQAAPRPQRAS